jgi:hypothetical protein
MYVSVGREFWCGLGKSVPLGRVSRSPVVYVILRRYAECLVLQGSLIILIADYTEH